MVKEWNGAFVHNSEFEAKQPQLEPHPVGADPQGLMNARPARVEFPVQDILPNNPFTTTAANASVSVSYPANQINEGTTFVRFQSVKISSRRSTCSYRCCRSCIRINNNFRYSCYSY